MDPIKINTYVEFKPEHHEGNMSITITCKASEKWKAELLLEILQTIEGWEFYYATSKIV
jgi:hypothetical protein